MHFAIVLLKERPCHLLTTPYEYLLWQQTESIVLVSRLLTEAVFHATHYVAVMAYFNESFRYFK